MSERFPFLDKDEIKDKSAIWRDNFNGGETKAAYPYKGGDSSVSRQVDRINTLHGFDLDKLVDYYLKRKSKVKILDIGAGAGFLTDQLREKFGKNAEVLSTGLSKQSARSFRIHHGKGRLHDNDLKWRSVLELSDYPEFDIILDTWGEKTYTTGKFIKDERVGYDIEALRRYIFACSKKLNPDGMASIVAYHGEVPLSTLKQWAAELGIEIAIGKGCSEIESGNGSEKIILTYRLHKPIKK